MPKFRHFIRQQSGIEFQGSRIKIHAFGQKLDTLCAIGGGVHLPFLEWKFVFDVKN